MFSFVTVYIGMCLDLQSLSYIDDRAFPGEGKVIPQGPFGFQELLSNHPDNVVPNIMFLLNSWLADGLLVRTISEPVFQGLT
jgi:hypothetical protein